MPNEAELKKERKKERKKKERKKMMRIFVKKSMSQHKLRQSNFQCYYFQAWQHSQLKWRESSMHIFKKYYRVPKDKSQ